jgi:DNA-binding NarL/FixJ family response regulator
MAQRRRILVMSKYRLSGEALCGHLSLHSDKYEVIYSPCLRTTDVPLDLDPDVVVICCQNCPCGVPAIRALFPNARIVVIARAPEADRQIQWIKGGAHGIVDEAREDIDFEHLDTVIDVVLADQVWAPRKIVSHLVLEGTHAKPNGGQEELTDRERQLIGFLQLGLSNAQIAERLFISEKTVKGHLTNMYRKLQVKNRLQATIKGREIRHRRRQPVP